MNEEVFESNRVVIFSVVVILNIGLIIAYFMTDFPLWFVLVALPVSILIGISTMKTKLIIKDGHLRYETWTGGEEVDLMNVGQIVTREVETVRGRTTGPSGTGTQPSGISVGSVKLSSAEDQERQTEKVIYIIDQDGRTFFSFPASMVGRKHRTRFREGIHAVNPEIDVF